MFSVSSCVLADHNNQTVFDTTLRVIKAASKFGKVNVLVTGNNCQSVSNQLIKAEHVSKVFLAQHPALEHMLPENLSLFLRQLTQDKGFTHIFSSSNTMGKTVLPRAAGMLNVQPITDVIEIKDEKTFIRPIYANNAISTVESSDNIKFITIRPTSFDPVAYTNNNAEIEEISVDDNIDAKLSKWVKDDLSISDRPDLGSAKIVVSGGRGMQDKERFEQLYPLADLLGAAVGATRAAVDANFCSNDLQVGQTGKVVAPQLYIAMGLSGAIQHVAGIKDSKVIVGINKDPDAPIFQVTDFGLSMDLFKVLPTLTDLLKKKKIN